MNFFFTKLEEKDIGNIWFQQDGAKCHTTEVKLDVLRPVFEDRIIIRKADVVWPPRSCDLTPLDYYLWGTVKDKRQADKSETIEALKENIREVIGKIQLHTIDNVLKIGSIMQATAWPAEIAICMKLFSIINRKECTFKYKKRNLRKLFL